MNNAKTTFQDGYLQALRDSATDKAIPGLELACDVLERLVQASLAGSERCGSESKREKELTKCSAWKTAMVQIAAELQQRRMKRAL